MSQYDLLGSDDNSKDLCFDRNVFLKESFSIDDFLKDHRSISMEVLRDDMGTFLKTLRLSMIELINKDYEDFVNLSKDLIGLNSGIENIESPLGQLRDDVKQVRMELQDTISGIHNCLEQQKEIRKSKKELLHLTQVMTSVDKLKSMLLENEDKPTSLDIIERAATEYNQLQFSMSKCIHAAESGLNHTIKQDTQRIGTVLPSRLKNFFLACICEKQIDDLSRCLQIFVSLDKVEEAHALVKENVIIPWLRNMINETSLEKNNNNLKVLYEEVLGFVDLQLKELLQITAPKDKEPAVKGFNFITYSLWTELEQCLELQLALIFQQHPCELFQRRHADSMFLLEELERRCGSQTAAEEFRRHEKYQTFLVKWNLSVYFKIRFQEISGHLEKKLKDSQLSRIPDAGQESYMFEATNFTLKCLQRCWNKQVYIKQLGVAFWRLSLQILSRYTVWVNIMLVSLFQKSPVSASNEKQINGPPSDWLERLDILRCLASDSMKVAGEASTFLTECMKHIPICETARDKLQLSLQVCLQNVKQCEPQIVNSIVDLIVSYSVSHLPEYGQTATRYRYKKDTLTTPSNYIQQVVSLPTQFNEFMKDRVDKDTLQNWLTLVFKNITQVFHKYVHDELNYVKNVGSGLRRMQHSKEKPNKSVNLSENMSEKEQKICQQLVEDVRSFQSAVLNMGVDSRKLILLQELVQLVDSPEQIAKQ